jgi:hypothetical protein
MLNKEMVKEFLVEEFEDIGIPKDISLDDFTEMFCKYCEDDTYEWLKDNLKNLFQYSDADLNWKHIKEKIEEYKNK